MKKQGVEYLGSICEHAWSYHVSSTNDGGQTAKRVDAQLSGWFDVFACSLLFCVLHSLILLSTAVLVLAYSVCSLLLVARSNSNNIDTQTTKNNRHRNIERATRWDLFLYLVISIWKKKSTKPSKKSFIYCISFLVNVKHWRKKTEAY